MTDSTAEMQADDAPIEEIQEGDDSVESTDSSAVTDDENANDNGENEEGEGQEAPLFTPEQQEIFDKAIGKKVGATRAAERELEAARQRIADLEAKVPVEARPTIPDIVDPYDAEFEQKVAARDKAIVEAAKYDARQEAQKEQMEGLKQQEAQKQQEALYGVATTYTERAKALGVTADELAKSGQVVAQHGISDDVTLHILQDEKGPAITKYLAANPLALDELHSMNPMQAAVHIENVVKPAALASKKTSNAPPPSTNLDGGGSPPSERGPAGAKFE